MDASEHRTRFLLFLLAMKFRVPGILGKRDGVSQFFLRSRDTRYYFKSCMLYGGWSCHFVMNAELQRKKVTAPLGVAAIRTLDRSGPLTAVKTMKRKCNV